MKKVTSIFLVFLLALTVFSGAALAEDPVYPGSDVSFTDYTGDVKYTGDEEAYAIMLLDEDSGTILYQKNIDEQIEPASTTKIMTVIVALENGDLEEKVTISSKAAGQRGSTLHPELIKNEQIVLKDLLNGMMMASGNDAAVAVAEGIGGSVSGFVDMMNAKASELGMEHTHFVTPNGLHDEEHITTARDMARLTLYAMQNPQFREIVNQDSYKMPGTNKRSSGRTEENTNKLMQTDETKYFYQYATGIKTGSTPAAGDCLVSSATKDGMNLICLVYKVKDSDPVRWTMTKDLFEWGFDNFETIKLSDIMADVKPAQTPVEDYIYNDPGQGVLIFDKPDVTGKYITLPKAEAQALLDGTDTIETVSAFTDTVAAPVNEGDVLGTVEYKSVSTGDIVYSGSLVAPRDVEKEGISAPSVAPTLPPTAIADITSDGDETSGPPILLFIILTAALVAFLVIRMIMANKNRRKRFKKRRPHYSYRIK